MNRPDPLRPDGVTPAAPPREAAGPPDEALRDEMLLLHQGIDAALEGADRRVIHFTSARPGEGTSTIVRAYGRALAEALHRSVLIVDANGTNPGQHVHFGVEAQPGWDEVVVHGEEVERAIHSTSTPNLSVTPLSGRVRSVADVLDRAAAKHVFAQLRERFDTILVDSSPVLRPGAVALAGSADGVVLVLEADRTRWPAAARARAVIEERGGTVLGVVLNRRRYHIPGAVYRRL